MKMRFHSKTDQPAFTLVELIVTLAVISLSLTLVSARAGSRSGGPSYQCLENTRRLVSAWLMYAADNLETLPVNLHGAQAQGGNFPSYLGPGWAAGWLDWTTSPDNTNVSFIVDKRWATLAPYNGFSTRLLKCPADTSLSREQVARGWTARIRSYSLSVALGAGNAEAGPWDQIYHHVTKTSDMHTPVPGQTFAFIDQDSDSLDDPAFFSPSGAAMVENPASRHNGSGSVAFADGHAEFHKWSGTLNPEADIHWLSSHTQRVSEQSY